jgi:hypothetical protein
MSSKASIYRRENPEYYQKEREKDKERVKILYHNNLEYREKTKQRALERYYRIKQEKGIAIEV